MAGVSPITNHPSVQPAGIQSSKPQTTASVQEFRGMLKGLMDKVNGDQQVSVGAVKDLISGRSEDIVSVVSAMAKADMSFKLLMGVRNKVVDAYRQTMNMHL